jgi:hypothetical protein
MKMKMKMKVISTLHFAVDVLAVTLTLINTREIAVVNAWAAYCF